MTTLGSIHTALITAYAAAAADARAPHRVIYRNGKGENSTYTIVSRGDIPKIGTRLTLNEIVDLLQDAVTNDRTIEAKTKQACGELIGKMGQRKIINAGYNGTCGGFYEFCSRIQNLFCGYGFQTSAERAFALQAKLAPAKPAPVPVAANSAPHAAGPAASERVETPPAVPAAPEQLTKAKMREFAGRFHYEKPEADKIYQPAQVEFDRVSDSVIEEIRNIAYSIRDGLNSDGMTTTEYRYYKLNPNLVSQSAEEEHYAIDIEVEYAGKSAASKDTTLAKIPTVIAILKGYLQEMLKVDIKCETESSIMFKTRLTPI